MFFRRKKFRIENRTIREYNNNCVVSVPSEGFHGLGSELTGVGYWINRSKWWARLGFEPPAPASQRRRPTKISL